MSGLLSHPRVLHVVPASFRKDGGVLGGAERYVTELARHMADVVPTELLTFGPTAEEWTIGNLRVLVTEPWCHVRGQQHNPFHPRLWSDVRRADVVHFHQKHLLISSYGALLCRVMGRKAFVTDLGGGGTFRPTSIRTVGIAPTSPTSNSSRCIAALARCS